MDLMRTIIGRIAAVVAATITTWLISFLGVGISEQGTAELTEALTLIGVLVWGLIYAVVHKLIDRKVNPMDVAKTPEN